MKILLYLTRAIDGINERIGRAVAWLNTLLVLVVCYDVFTRYLLRRSVVAIQEMEWHLFAVIFLLGAAYTLKYDRHVRVDVLYMKFSPRRRAMVDFLGSLIFLLPFSLLVIWSSRNFVLNSFSIHETSPDPGGLPARYLLKACIPLGFFLVFLQGISLAIESGRKWLRSPASDGDDHDA